MMKEGLRRTFEWFVNDISVLSGSSTYVPVENDAGKSITVTAQYQALAELALCCGVGELEAIQMLVPTATDSSKPTSLP